MSVNAVSTVDEALRYKHKAGIHTKYTLHYVYVPVDADEGDSRATPSILTPLSSKEPIPPNTPGPEIEPEIEPLLDFGLLGLKGVTPLIDGGNRCVPRAPPTRVCLVSCPVTLPTRNVVPPLLVPPYTAPALVG